MAGLNRHMRDLLMAKRPETLRLIEMTGTLLERYRAQAEACSVEFLFGAISILTELDGKIRQSSNQRLLVELGLMKIAGLGQKKNDPLTPDSYPLPEIDAASARRSTPTAPTPAPGEPSPTTIRQQMPTAAGPAAAPQPASPTTAQPSVQPSAGGAPQQASSRQPATGTAASTAAAASQPVTAAQTAAAQRPLRSPLGTSLSELLAATEQTDEQAEQATAAVPVVDPESEAKLERARGAIFALIREKRPRFVAAFEQMQFRGNTIGVSVPTAALREEILRSKTEMLMRIVELAGIHGVIELEVRVNEQIRAARPIKLEDRVRYMTEKNPLVAELRKALDLEVE